MLNKKRTKEIIKLSVTIELAKTVILHPDMKLLGEQLVELDKDKALYLAAVIAKNVRKELNANNG